MKASDLFVKALENEGVQYIFGVPGEENLDFVESLRKSKIKLIVTRHEQAAGFMAATMGRLTGCAGVCLSTLGPGATNLVTAAAYAQLGAMPMLMISGQKPIKKSKQGKFQVINTIEMMRPITKYSRQIVNGHNIPSVVREAIRLAKEERPGAVHIELPEDIAQENIDEHLFAPTEARQPIADEQALAVAAKLIAAAHQPLVLIGAADHRDETCKAITDFVEKTGIPFFNTQMGKGIVDEHNPLYMGTAALSAKDYIHCAIDRSDLVINIGHDVIEKPPFFMEHGGKKVIHINFFSAQVDGVYFPQVEVVGDIPHSINELARRLNKSKKWDFSYFMKVKSSLESHLSKRGKDNRFPFLPDRLVADVRKVMPKDGIVTLDNGLYKIWFARNYKAYRPQTLLLDNALASMGAGLPSAMGAKIVYPKKKVVAICGDGGFMMNSQELETAVRLKMDLVVVILRDDAYGMIRWKQQGMGFKDFGMCYGNPDFVKYAESYGAYGTTITKTEDFAPTLKECLNKKGVCIVDVPIDYSESEQDLMQNIESQTCMI